MDKDNINKDHLVEYIFNSLNSKNNYEYFENTLGDKKVNNLSGYYYGYEIPLRDNMYGILIKSMDWAERKDYADFEEKCEESDITFYIQIIQKTLNSKTLEIYNTFTTRDHFEKIDSFVKSKNTYFSDPKTVDINRIDDMKNTLLSKLYTTIRKEKIKNVLDE